MIKAIAGLLLLLSACASLPEYTNEDFNRDQDRYFAMYQTALDRANQIEDPELRQQALAQAWARIERHNGATMQIQQDYQQGMARNREQSVNSFVTSLQQMARPVNTYRPQPVHIYHHRSY